eukprot:m.160945 g.160945  ORF g.160945 m.160945 type:complete len:219 (+) comp16514_c0_seq1:1821-2477(+)
MAARLTPFGVVAPNAPNEHAERALAVLYPEEDAQPPTASNSDDTLSDDTSIQTLKRLGLDYKLFHHEPASTIAAWSPHCLQHAPDAIIAKNLFSKEKKKPIHVLITAMAETTVNTKLVQSHFGLKNLRMANEGVLNDLLGLQGGAVTPLGVVNDTTNQVNVVLDAAMMRAGKPVLMHPVAGNAHTVVLQPQDLLKYLEACDHQPLFADFETQTLSESL